MEMRYLSGAGKINECEKEYLERKISKVNKLLKKEDPNEIRADIEIEQDKRKIWTITATIVISKRSFRVQKKDNNLLKTIDMIEEALMKQIRRQNEKTRDTVRNKKRI